MIEGLVRAAETSEFAKTQKENLGAKSFNPDKRLKPETRIEGSKEKVSFNPDKRVDSIANEVSDKTERIKQLANEYRDDVVENSEFPETLKDFRINPTELHPVSTEIQNELRKQFGNRKDSLIKEWENKYKTNWPRYTEDVYDVNGNKIRKAGDRYDAHHKIPLSLGGLNIVENITPLRADVHYDHRGVHSRGSAFNQMHRVIKGIE